MKISALRTRQKTVYSTKTSFIPFHRADAYESIGGLKKYVKEVREGSRREGKNLR
jgi:hypothetical protein